MPYYAGLQQIFFTQEDGQIFVVGNLLVLGDVYLPGLLEDGLVVPVGIDLSQYPGQSVVLPEEDYLEDGELGVLVGSSIT